MKKIVHVAVGVIFDAQKNILIAKRSDDQHQGGYGNSRVVKLKRMKPFSKL